MAWEFNAFASTDNGPTEVVFDYTGNFGSSDNIEVRIQGTNLDYTESTGQFGPTAVIQKLVLFDITQGIALQTVDIDPAAGTATAIAASSLLAAALSIGAELAGQPGGVPGFDSINGVQNAAGTLITLTLKQGATIVGFLHIEGTGFVTDTTFGTVTAVKLFAPDNSTPVWTKDYLGDPQPVGAVAMSLGSQDILYRILTLGDDTLTSNNQTSDGFSPSLDPGDGANTVIGSSSFGGFVTYAGSTQAVTIDLALQTVSKPDFTTDTLTNIGGAEGSAFADTIDGDAFNNILIGGSGDDVLDGRGVTADSLGLGFDVLSGGHGNDTFNVNPDGGSALNYVVSYQLEEQIGGSSGVTVNLDSVAHVIAAGTATDAFGDTDTLNGVHGVAGTSFADTFDGSALDDAFTPGGGNDVINGHGGGSDNDLLIYSPVTGLFNAFNYTEGIDVNFTAAGAGTAASKTTGEVGTDTFQDIEHVLGTQFADSFTVTGAGVISATGMDGNDTFTGGAGSADSVDYSYEVIGGGAQAVIVNFGSGNVGGITTGQVRDTFGGIDTLSGIERVKGSAFNDLFFGGAAAEVFDGGEGGDVIFGGAGADIILGGGTISASGLVADLLAGDAGNDTINGGSLSNLVLVNYRNENGILGIIANLDSQSHDTVGAGHVRDTFGDTDTLLNIRIVVGSRNADVFWGGAGDEVFTPGTGNDTVHGGGGSDEMWYSGIVAVRSGLNQLSESFGYDGGLTVTFTGDGSLGTVAGNTGGGITVETGTDTFDGIERVIGSEFADTFSGSSAAGAHNVFAGMRGNDTYTGGSGSGDTIDYSYEAADGGAGGVIVNLGNSTVTDTFGDTDSLTGIENVIGTSFSDTLTGNNAANLLDGRQSDDTMNGGSGDDTYVVDSLADIVQETGAGLAGGKDQVNALISYSLSSLANVEDLVLLGAAIAGDGNALDNTITGNSGANTLDGGNGNDLLDGGIGADSLIGGAGNDTFVLADGTDNVNDTSGVDTITSTISRNLSGFSTIENLTLLGSALTGSGNALANTITGNAFGNTLDGGIDLVADRLIGQGGNDIYLAGTADLITEIAGQGADTVRATQSYVLGANISIEVLETILATATTAINLTGNNLANTITGNNGVNIITGGAGRDVMKGGIGRDIFDFNAITETTKVAATRDVITDFTHLSDRIDLRTIDANSKVAGNQNFTFQAVKGAAFTGVAGQVHYKAFGGNTLIEGDINGDKIADFHIQLTGAKVLSAGDFIL